MRVAEHLDLDVARPLDRLLEVDGAVAERRRSPRAARRRTRRRTRPRAATRRMPLPPPPAAALIRTGKPIFLAAASASSAVGKPSPVGPLSPGTTGVPAARHRLARLGLAAHLAHRVGRRADERDAGGGAGVGEVFVLRQEAVAGVDRVGAAGPAGGEDLVDHEVALRGGRRADRDGAIGQLDVRREPVDVAVDRDGLDPALLARTHDANGDLAAVGDEDAADRPELTATSSRTIHKTVVALHCARHAP